MGKTSTNKLISNEFTWETAALTHTGAVRKVNEDAIMSNHSQGHWTVADGMGGHNAGDVASSEICSALEKLTQTDDFPKFIDNIELSVEQVNSMLVEMGERDNGVIGSTIVGMAFNKKHVVSYWAGDSRAYILRDTKLKMITIDHTVVQEMLEAGLIKDEEVNTHPDKNIITRAVGSDQEILLDFTIDEVVDGDIFIICSDGVEKEVSDPELESLLNEKYKSLDACVENIVNVVVERGARDNVSVILVKFTSIDKA